MWWYVMHTQMGMLCVSREITPFWYGIHTFVLTVQERREKALTAFDICVDSLSKRRVSLVTCAVNSSVAGVSDDNGCMGW